MFKCYENSTNLTSQLKKAKLVNGNTYLKNKKGNIC